MHIGSEHDPSLEWFCDVAEQPGLANDLAVLEENVLGPNDDRLYRRMWNGETEVCYYAQGGEADTLGGWTLTEREFETMVLPKYPAEIWEQHRRRIDVVSPDGADADAS